MSRPVDVCPNCGDQTWDGEYVHEECFEEYAASCGLSTAKTRKEANDD